MLKSNLLKNRNISIDFLKGLAIFLVVVGHLIQSSIIDFDHNLIYRVIYSFHMPLFFFLSGYVLFLTKEINPSLLKRRFFSLIVPFLFWALLFYIFRGDYHESVETYLLDIIVTPDKGLWFLWILYSCYVVFFISLKSPIKPQWALLLSTVLLLIIGITSHSNIFGNKLLSKEFPFFAMGYVFNKYNYMFMDICKRFWKYTLPLFFIFALFWIRNGPPLFYKSQRGSAEVTMIYTFWVAALGIFSLLGAFIDVKNNLITKTIVYMGQHSLSIYAIHFFFLNLTHLNFWNGPNYYISLILYSILLTLCSLTIDYIIAFNSVLTFLLLGKRASRK